MKTINVSNNAHLLRLNIAALVLRKLGQISET